MESFRSGREKKGEVLKINKNLTALPKEKEVLHILALSKQKQTEMIYSIWKSYMPRFRQALRPYMNIIEDILRQSENKARDLIFAYATIASIEVAKEELEVPLDSRQRGEKEKYRGDKKRDIGTTTGNNQVLLNEVEE